jgi:hypothetical protein
MPQRPPCTKCAGEGLQPRDGDDAKAEVHPILAATKGLCDRCGGSCLEPEPTHATNMSAAANLAG